MVFLVPPLLIAAAFWLGRYLGAWRAAAALGAPLGLTAGFLVINDGWRGHGWGDFGVELNLAVAALMVVAAVLGGGTEKARWGHGQGPSEQEARDHGPL